MSIDLNKIIEQLRDAVFKEKCDTQFNWSSDMSFIESTVFVFPYDGGECEVVIKKVPDWSYGLITSIRATDSDGGNVFIVNTKGDGSIRGKPFTIVDEEWGLFSNRFTSEFKAAVIDKAMAFDISEEDFDE